MPPEELASNVEEDVEGSGKRFWSSACCRAAIRGCGGSEEALVPCGGLSDDAVEVGVVGVVFEKLLLCSLEKQLFTITGSLLLVGSLIGLLASSSSTS